MVRVETVKERKSGPLSRFMSEADDFGPERDYVGEIVESSTTELIAEARELHGAPSFGQFIRVEGDMPVVGIVFNVFTHSLEPNRRPTAYGKTEQELGPAPLLLGRTGGRRAARGRERVG